MLKRTAFLITIIMSFSTSSQYVQNIDTLSKKDIKNMILSLDEDDVINHKFQNSRKGKAIGGFMMIAGSVIVLKSALTPAENDNESLEAYANGLLGLVITVAGLVVFESSRIKQNKIIRSFRENQRVPKTIQVRDEKEILKVLNPRLH